MRAASDLRENRQALPGAARRPRRGCAPRSRTPAIDFAPEVLADARRGRAPTSARCSTRAPAGAGIGARRSCTARPTQRRQELAELRPPPRPARRARCALAHRGARRSPSRSPSSAGRPARSTCCASSARSTISTGELETDPPRRRRGSSRRSHEAERRIEEQALSASAPRRSASSIAVQAEAPRSPRRSRPTPTGSSAPRSARRCAARSSSCWSTRSAA